MSVTSKIAEITRQFSLIDTSSTYFIESMAGRELNITVIRQEENDVGILKRSVLLFFNPYKPIMYCESLLNINVLSEREKELLLWNEIPIGKIFSNHSKDVAIKKNNLFLKNEFRNEIADLLKTEEEQIYRKSYEYWVKSRNIGTIYEYFSEKSLFRILQE